MRALAHWALQRPTPLRAVVQIRHRLSSVITTRRDLCHIPEVGLLVRITSKAGLKRIFQFVALALAVALLAVPAAALSSCWTSSDESQHGCDPDRPMMATMNAHHAGSTVQAVQSGTSCCDISSGKPNPSTQLQVPTDSSRTAVTPPQSSGTFAAVTVPARSDSPPSILPLPAASPQAVLCTFLI
jgi:hypothetical protein